MVKIVTRETFFFNFFYLNKQVQNEGRHQGDKLGWNGVFGECGGHRCGAADVQEPPELSRRGSEHRRSRGSLVLWQ